jgi:hypothetical protein
MRAKNNRLRGSLKIRLRREIGPVRLISRGTPGVEKTRRVSRTHGVLRGAGRPAARVEVRRVRVRFERPIGAAGSGGRSAVRVAVGVGRGDLVIVIVQMNLKQESCI